MLSFGLPLDIRHVALSSASRAISPFSLGSHVNYVDIGIAILGTPVIGVLNFRVSFYVALSVARYAQNINDRLF